MLLDLKAIPVKLVLRARKVIQDLRVQRAIPVSADLRDIRVYKAREVLKVIPVLRVRRVKLDLRVKKAIRETHLPMPISQKSSLKVFVALRVFRASKVLKVIRARKVILGIVALRVKLVLRALRAIKARHSSTLILRRNSWKDFVAHRVYRVKKA